MYTWMTAVAKFSTTAYVFLKKQFIKNKLTYLYPLRPACPWYIVLNLVLYMFLKNVPTPWLSILFVVVVFLFVFLKKGGY
eukprot:SAG31_NODE_28129_length_415_cov_0.664557_1_plen_80_part_00